MAKNKAEKGLRRVMWGCKVVILERTNRNSRAGKYDLRILFLSSTAD